MDRQKAKILFDLLKSSSSEKVNKGLREIKKRLLTNSENIAVFSNLGLAKQCLKLIQRPNEDILNGTLSILSIGCTDQSIRNEIYDHNGALHLYNVLKSTKSEPLQLRACRTIANQSQHKVSCEAFFKFGCVELIITLLQECKEDETKCTSIRALRLLGDNGEHCRKIVVERGIYHICNSSKGSSNSHLTLEVFKALAHFSRITHPACLKQIMEGTDDMAFISKYAENPDNILQDSILRTILNIVRGCGELKKQCLYNLTSSLMDNLAMAKAPTIIVSELQSRRVPEISEEKLILALCEFCEGFGTCSKFTYPPLFMGRTWSQVVDAGGIHLFVSFLSKKHDNIEIRSAVLRALTGIEYILSSKEKILKHLLVANVMPILAEQFDDVIVEYRKVRRESQEGGCAHTIAGVSVPQTDTSFLSNVSDKKSETESDVDGTEITHEDKEICNSKLVDGEKIEKVTNSKQLSCDSILDLISPEPKLLTFSKDEEAFCSSSVQAGKLGGIYESGISKNKPSSPVLSCSRSSVSCSPTSNQSSSGSGPNSPWSPSQNRCESPTFSPPFNFSSVGGSGTWESPNSSRQSSPSSSPVHNPIYYSPVQPSSPIKPPSDWEYDDDELEESYDDGRFSPAIPKSKDLEGVEDTEDMDEEDLTNTEEAHTDDDGVASDGDNPLGAEDAIESDIKERLVISSTSQKRARESADLPDCSGISDSLEKKMKTGSGAEICCSVGDTESEMGKKPLAVNSSQVQTSLIEGNHEFTETSIQESGQTMSSAKTELSKTPFIRLNQIKFRVRKKPRRQESLESQSPTKQNVRVHTRRTSSVCSENSYSDLTPEEFRWLQLLELIVRVIGQIVFVKETINTVCREFVPRIMTYLSTAQIIHKSATQTLKLIAKNSLSIPLLLDSLFIPYVAVELGEAGDPENPSGCTQCHILSEGAIGFLKEMTNFFNHIHHFGCSEVKNRLHPSRDHAVREGCVMTLPHVTRCPKLLHDFMVSYPAMDLLMDVLKSDRPPNEASYMYATAAISRLATTLQLEKQLQPVKCPVCSERRTHSSEEITMHLRIQQEQLGTRGASGIETSVQNKSRECKFNLDKVKDITFTLEGGETLSANREFLSEKNDVLHGMLMGSFAEGSSASVDLPETSKNSLEMLIHFLYGCQCDFMENADFRSYLQLVFLSQMYMVKNLDAFAVLKMMSAIGEGNDIIMLYESGLGRIDEKIVLQAICTTLVRPMKTWKRARWFKELFQSNHADDIDHNIRVILHHPLDINRLVCNCDQSLSLYAANESVYSKLR